MKIGLQEYGFKATTYCSNDLGNFIGEDQDTLYTWVGYEPQLPLEIGLDLRYGRMDLKDPIFWSGSGQSRKSYREWEAKLTRDLLGVTWGLSYVDTDLSENECMSNYGFSDTCTATVIASVSKSL